MFYKKPKEPEKPKPDFQGEQHEHKACLMLFKNSNAHEKINEFKSEYHKITVIEGRTLDRLKAMLDSCKQISTHYVRLQTNCIQSVQIAKTYEEMIAIRMGLIPVGETQGIGICPGCLDRTIFACEEVLQSLKDIQIATKEYV